MKTLTTVLESAMTPLYESLLDDLEELEQNQTTSLRNDILKGTWFRLGSDMKTIIFDPEKINYLVDNRDTDAVVHWTKNKNYETNINISNIDVCKKLDLKFQPLAYIHNDIVGNDKEWLKYFDCEYAVNFSCHLVEGNKGSTIDLSLIKFPIKGSISITGYAEVGKVIPYPNRVEVVRFFVPSQQPITGWKCRNMIIGNAGNIKYNLTKDKKTSMTEEEQNMIFQDWINELLKNNPDTETIFLGQLGRYADCFKVVTKGSGDKRKCVKLTKIPSGKWAYILYDKEVEKMGRDVETWRWQHADLYECDGSIAATPGNTLGMGNPMIPTVTEPGTEPVIPKYPRNKKKRKSLKESLLDDFDKMSDFQDIEMILDDPNFNKNNFNKLKRLFKKAGGGEDYTDQDKNNTETMFIGYKRGGLNNTSEVIVGIPAVSPTLTRTYFPGRRRVYNSDQPVQLTPHIWAVTNVPAAGSGHFWGNTAGPISIPDKYAPYFKMLMQNAPEWGSKKFRES